MLLNTPEEEIVYGNNKKVKLKKVFTNKEKIASAIYVYDCINHNIGFVDIRNELGLYKKKNPDIKTLEEYYEVIKYYIDGQHYKELITGYALP